MSKKRKSCYSVSDRVAMEFQRQNPTDEMFILHTTLTAQIVVCQSLRNAMSIAQNLLQSDTYFDGLVAAKITSAKERQLVRDKIKRVFFDLTLVYAKKDYDAYMCVYHRESANTIFINPLLLSKISLREADFRGKGDMTGLAKYINKAAKFLVAKLVHEATHLFYGEFNDYFAANPGATMPEGKSMVLNNQRIFVRDYGYVLELLLFKAITEVRSTRYFQDVFGLDDIICYESIADWERNVGYIATCSDVIDLTNCNIDTNPIDFQYIRPSTTPYLDDAIVLRMSWSRNNHRPRSEQRLSSYRMVPTYADDVNDLEEGVDDSGLGPSRR